MPRPEKVRLGEILLQQGLLTEQQLNASLEEQRKSGRKLGRVFVDKGYVSEEQISTALAKQLQVPYVNLKQFTVKPEVANRLSEVQARRFRAIVLEDCGAFFRVAMAEPTDLFAYDEIARALRRDIQLAVVTESLLLQTIDRVYRRFNFNSFLCTASHDFELTRDAVWQLDPYAVGSRRVVLRDPVGRYPGCIRQADRPGSVGI